MYRIVLISLVISCWFTADAQNKPLTINGQIQGLPDGTKIRLKRDGVIIAQSISKKGHFTARSSRFQEGFYFLEIQKPRDSSAVSVTLFLEGDPEVNLSGSMNSLKELNVGSSHKLVMEFTNLTKNIKGDSSIDASNRSQKIKSAILNFIKDNLNSSYSAWLIMKNKFLNQDSAYLRLDKSVMDSPYGRDLKLYLENNKKIITKGAMIPNFSSKYPDGKDFQLYDILGKHKLILIDFWGSWCIPCQAETPNVKKIYDAFRNKGFTVVTVALEYNKDSWLKALNRFDMPWIHVSEIKGRDESASRLFWVNAIPALVLIDGSGKIIDLDLTGSKIPSTGSLRGEALSQKIASILN